MGRPEGGWSCVLGAVQCNIGEARSWKTLSRKVIFTRKLCCVDLLLCREDFNDHV